MIDSIVNILLPVISEDTVKTDVFKQDNTTADSNDFSQLLGILMAQMGLSSMIIPQNATSSLSETEIDNTKIQQESVRSSVISKLGSSEGALVLENGGDSVDEISLRLQPAQEMSPIRGEESLGTINSIPVMTDLIQNATDISNIEEELLSKINIDTLKKQLVSSEQSNFPTTTETHPNLLQGENPSNGGPKVVSNLALKMKMQGENPSNGGPKERIPTNVNQAGRLESVELTQIQDTLHIKNIELSKVLPQKESELILLQLGKVPQEISTQSYADIENHAQQKLMDTVISIEQYLPESLDVETQEDVLRKILEMKLVSNSGDKNNTGSERKSDLSNLNSQLGITSMKIVKTKNEEMPNNITTTLAIEPKEVVPNLTSLRSVLTEQIRLAVKSEIKTITVKLEPESLGAMEIKIQEHSGKIGIQLATSNGDVHKVLSHGLPQLREVLKQEGIPVKEIQIVSTGTANLMLNQNLNPNFFSKEIQVEPVLYHFNKDTPQTVEETKPISSYHTGVLNLWV